MPDTQAISFKTWLILSAIGTLIFLMNIDYTAVNLVLVPVSLDLNEDLNNLQWLLSGYVLIWGAFVIPAGRIADIYGKRNTLFGGLILFTIGSCLAGASHTLGMMIIGRVIQGLGASIFTAPCWALIFTSAPPKKQGFVMGIILSFAGIGLATGPTLGGYIIEFLNWRWIFYINIPIGILVIFILLLFCKNDKQEDQLSKVDIKGTLILSSGLCLTVFGLNQIEVWGGADYRFWAFLSAGMALLVFFFLQDRKKSFRMMPSSLLRNKPFLISLVSIFCMSILFSLVLVLMGLYLQSIKKYSSYETGLIFFSMTISMGLLSPFGGQMVDKLGVKKPMIFGVFFTGLGTLVMAYLTPDSTLYWSILALFLAGTGLGVYFTAGNTAMMRSVPQKDLNVASGIYTMAMMMGNTLSIIFSTSLLVAFGRAELFKNLHSYKVHLTDIQYADLVDIIARVEHTPKQLVAFSSDQIPVLLRWIDQAFVYGFSLNMLLGTLVAVLVMGTISWGMKVLHAQENILE